MLVHGDNLTAKENHRTKYQDALSKQYLAEIREKYNKWHRENIALIGPSSIVSENDINIVTERVRLFEDYKNFLDQQKYAEKFDSRSNLHSSILEEFIYYLFKDLVKDFGDKVLIGKSHAFKDIFFAASNYVNMLEKPRAKIEIKDHDFVIGVTVKALLETEKQTHSREQLSEIPDEEKPKDSEINYFDIPAVVIECKTYLDKTMLEGSSRAAEELKARNPNGVYMVVMEWIKLSEQVNLRKYQVDQIYVLRQQKNTDREYRFLEGYSKNPINPNVIWHLYCTVRNHLTTDGKTTLESGIERGWLL
jgi:Bpu10I restriction endonuclease